MNPPETEQPISAYQKNKKYYQKYFEKNREKITKQIYECIKKNPELLERKRIYDRERQARIRREKRDENEKKNNNENNNENNNDL
jgi:hypothetical protein